MIYSNRKREYGKREANYFEMVDVVYYNALCLRVKHTTPARSGCLIAGHLPSTVVVNDF
jgi:hypothetical protein